MRPGGRINEGEPEHIFKSDIRDTLIAQDYPVLERSDLASNNTFVPGLPYGHGILHKPRQIGAAEDAWRDNG